MDETTATLSRALGHATEFLQGLSARPVANTVDAAALRKRLDVGLRAAGTPPGEVIDDLVAATEGGHLGSAGGRFFGWVIGGGLPAALAADWLVSAWDNNAGVHASAPAATVVEEIAGAWLLEILDLPREASFAFTTGCQMAHVTCLAAARNALLGQRGWDVERRGLGGAPAIRVLANAHRHGTLDRAIRLLGLGTDAVAPLATGDDAKVTPAVLSAALEASGAPTIVALDAADLNIGAMDPFAELIPLARDAGAWVHVDGAFGLWARASATHRAKTAGVEGAHSWATDAHKWLNTPKDIGVAIVTDRVAHRAAMSAAAAYIPAAADARDPLDWTPEWTRRARGFPVYAALRELGRDGVEALIDRCCAHAEALTRELGALPWVELVAPATLNQGLVRFRDPTPGAAEEDHDRFTLGAIAAINAEGTAFFSAGAWQGRRVMRISVVNWRTTEEDIRLTVEAVARTLPHVRARFR